MEVGYHVLQHKLASALRFERFDALSESGFLLGPEDALPLCVDHLICVRYYARLQGFGLDVQEPLSRERTGHKNFSNGISVWIFLGLLSSVPHPLRLRYWGRLILLFVHVARREDHGLERERCAS